MPMEGAGVLVKEMVVETLQSPDVLPSLLTVAKITSEARRLGFYFCGAGVETGPIFVAVDGTGLITIVKVGGALVGALVGAEGSLPSTWARYFSELSAKPTILSPSSKDCGDIVQEYAADDSQVIRKVPVRKLDDAAAH